MAYAAVMGLFDFVGIMACSFDDARVGSVASVWVEAFEDLSDSVCARFS